MPRVGNLGRDFDGLERRRVEALKSLMKGLSHAQIARELGVSRESVRRWHQKAVSGSAECLKKAGRAGRRPKLGATQLSKLREILDNRTPVSSWTLKEVAGAIADEFGIECISAHVWWILHKKLGYSFRMPAPNRPAAVDGMDQKSPMK